MWKEHLKSLSFPQELVPNSQSILTRCTFEEFENSTTSNHTTNQTSSAVYGQWQGMPKQQQQPAVHTHALTQIQTGVKMFSRDMIAIHISLPSAHSEQTWPPELFEEGGEPTVTPALPTTSRTRPTNPDPKWLVRGPIHPCEKLVQTPLLKSPRIIRVVQSDWLIDYNHPNPFGKEL